MRANDRGRSARWPNSKARSRLRRLLTWRVASLRSESFASGCQKFLKISKSTRSGGRSSYRERLLSVRSMSRSESLSNVVSRLPIAARVYVRSAKARERDCTYPALWAASCTESAKTRVFFSSPERSVIPKRFERDTERSVETDEPRNRIESLSPHEGQTCCSPFSSASPPSKVSTGIDDPLSSSAGVGSLKLSSRVEV